MTELVRFLVAGIVSRPDAVQVHAVEHDSVVEFELSVDPVDIERVQGPDGETLRALRTVLSASAGQRKAVLELIETDGGSADDRLPTEETDSGS